MVGPALERVRDRDFYVILAGRVVVVEGHGTPDRLREAVSQDPKLGDVILRAFVVRRELLIGVVSGIRIIGSRFSPDTRRPREFAARNRLPYTWIDLEHVAAAEACSSSSTSTRTRPRWS
jgi:hypothetical protein